MTVSRTTQGDDREEVDRQSNKTTAAKKMWHLQESGSSQASTADDANPSILC